MSRRHVRRGSRGVSALETLFALAFVFLIGLVLVQLSRGMRFYTEQEAKIENMSDTRQVMNGTVRALQNARALGFCEDDPGAGIPLDDCRRVGEIPFQIRSASMDGTHNTTGVGGAEVCFWGLFEPSTFQFEPLDLICVTENVAQRQLLLRTQQAAGDWTSPAIHDAATDVLDPGAFANRTGGAWRNQLIGFVDPDQTFFMFFGADGSILSEAELQTDEGRRNVALIRITVAVTGGGDRRIRDGESRAELTYDVALRGSRLSRDASGVVGGFE